MFQQREELLLLVFLHVVQDAGAGDVLGVHLAGSQIQALLPDLLIHNNTLSQVAGTGSSGALARAGDMAALFLRGGSISSGYAVIKLGLDLLFLAEQVRIVGDEDLATASAAALALTVQISAGLAVGP